MVTVKNNLGRSLCLNLQGKKSLRLNPYSTKEIAKKEVSTEVESNVKAGYITLTEKTIANSKTAKEVDKKEAKEDLEQRKREQEKKVAKKKEVEKKKKK